MQADSKSGNHTAINRLELKTTRKAKMTDDYIVWNNTNDIKPARWLELPALTVELQSWIALRWRSCIRLKGPHSGTAARRLVNDRPM